MVDDKITWPGYSEPMTEWQWLKAEQARVEKEMDARHKERIQWLCNTHGLWCDKVKS